MSPILGHIIVLSVLGVITFFAARFCVRDIRASLKTGSCGSCGGNCASCGRCCSAQPRQLNK